MTLEERSRVEPIEPGQIWYDAGRRVTKLVLRTLAAVDDRWGPEDVEVLALDDQETMITMSEPMLRAGDKTTQPLGSLFYAHRRVM